jgi:hypothetical protein
VSGVILYSKFIFFSGGKKMRGKVLGAALRGAVCVAVCTAAVWGQAKATGAAAPNSKRAEVLVLGTYHMANPGHDVFNMKADDVLSPKRQKEIDELIAVLKKFKPTKIAIERDIGTETTQKQYAEYLAGTHMLTRNEIEQIGFRLAKEMNLTTIYPVDAEGDFFPLQRVLDYAREKGEAGKVEEMMKNTWGEMVKEQGEFLGSHTVLQTLGYINSDARAARDVGYYFQLARYGERGNYPGPDLLAEWYRRNIRIYNNVSKLISGPGERVLVIFGSGHLGWLRPDFAGDPAIRLRKLEEFAGKRK